MQLMEMCSGRQEQGGQWLHLGRCEPPILTYPIHPTYLGHCEPPIPTYPIHPTYSLRALTDHVNAIINFAPVILHQTFMKSLP